MLHVGFDRARSEQSMSGKAVFESVPTIAELFCLLLQVTLPVHVDRPSADEEANSG